MGVFQNNLMGAAAAAASAGGADFYDYQIANSYRSMAGVGYFSRTPSGAGNRKTYTISFWFKRTKLTETPGEFDIFCNAQESSTTNYTDSIRFQDGDKLQIAFKGTLSGNLITTRVFRDTSAWMHIVCAVDTTQGTAANRVKLYINGEQETDFSTETYPSADYQGGWCNSREHALGRFTGASYTTIGNFYMANFALVDGSQLAPTSFGTSKNGVWIPDDLSELTWGTTGTWVRFESSSDLGNDSSGNNNDWTNNSVATHDQMLDSPTFDSSSNGGNFATINAVYRGDQTSDAYYGVLSEGNLKHSYSGSSDAYCACTHKVPASGKWYFEYLINAGGGTSSYSPAAGIMDPNKYTYADRGSDGSTGSIVYGNHDNKVYKDASISGTYSGSRGSNDDVMGIAVDMDNGAFYVSKNGTFQTIDGGSQGDPTSGSSKTGAGATWTPASEFTSGMVPLSAPTGGSQPIITMNFGQEGTFAGQKTAGGNSDTNGYGNFFNAVPSGYKAICSANLTTADEVDPAQTDDDYPQKLFNAIAYSGDGGGSQTTGFQPDLVWVKRRDGDQGNGLFDSTRGTGKVINSNDNGAQVSSNGLTSFNSTGYTMGTYYNQSGNTYVSWSWRVNGGTTATNSNGSVDSTVQVDPSGAFSIATFRGGITSTGTGTVGHGLSKAPSMIIFKGYDNLGGGDGQWWVGHDALTSWNYFLRLNSNVAPIDKSGNGSMSSPTSTVFSINNTDGLGYSTIDTLAYCFANIEGYCKTGEYEGNGDADGTFVYTGFRPALVTIKRIDSTGSWHVYDDARDTYNAADTYLLWDTGGSDDTAASNAIDILSNGFKLRNTAAGLNGSGNDYIYLAMAHNPFKYATAR
jgi:hypothetical protein